MVTMNIHRAEIEVLSATGNDGSPLKVLVLIDPATGFQVHAPLREEVAKETAKALAGQQVEIHSTMPTPPPASRRG